MLGRYPELEPASAEPIPLYAVVAPMPCGGPSDSLLTRAACRIGQVQQFAEYVGCDFGERPGFSVSDPLCECDPEHRGAGLRRQGGGRLANAARTQGRGDRRREARGLMLLAFLQRGILVDHSLSHAGVGAALIGE